MRIQRRLLRHGAADRDCAARKRSIELTVGVRSRTSSATSSPARTAGMVPLRARRSLTRRGRTFLRGQVLTARDAGAARRGPSALSKTGRGLRRVLARRAAQPPSFNRRCDHLKTQVAQKLLPYLAVPPCNVHRGNRGMEAVRRAEALPDTARHALLICHDCLSSRGYSDNGTDNPQQDFTEG